VVWAHGAGPPFWLARANRYTDPVKHGRIGRYELLHKIAAGGMAEIFLARQWGQGGFFRDVVIKRLFPHYAEHEHALRMFQDEARLLAELSHPNIPQVYDLGYADGYWYLAMEYLRGVSLADLCRAAAKASKPMPLAVAIGIVHQVCMALHHAHERRDREGRALRIVHRDVTPHNIMISLDAVVKVLDFGVAQTTARMDTDAGAVRGTYAYMGPEQVRGKPLDKRADVFAVGVILYELTTGRRLFRGSDVQVMTQIVEQDVTPPSRILSNYPGELEQVVLNALARDRSRRTPSAAHLALALDQFCMRHGLVTGPLVIAHYVRTLFPYEQASEEGMGIAQVPSPGSQGSAPPENGRGGVSAEELEERLLAEELRELQQRRGSAQAGRADTLRERPERVERPTPQQGLPEPELEELNADDLLLDDPDTVAPVAAADSPASALRIDEFDEDSEVKPFVLLSPKRKQPAQRTASEGAFMTDLERRLREDLES
jgi:eukaryotic-like serine/threonine-protein kinase